MKKFKNLFEQSPASDYKVKKDEDAEVKDIKPRSSGEEQFKNMHKVEKKGHPVADPAQHEGGVKAGGEHKGAEKAGEPVLKTYAQFAKMGGIGGDSYKGVGKSAGEKAAVMQGSSKIKEEVVVEGQKPYVSSDRDGKHVMNAAGKVAKSFKDMESANSYLKRNYNKLASVREEVEHIDEAFKAGQLRLKDGKTVKVDESTAKALNAAMGQLSANNRKRMEAEAMKDKQSFESMVKFAKAAV